MSKSIILALGKDARSQIRERLAVKTKSDFTGINAANYAAHTRQPVVFYMPIPPSVNNLFVNASRKRIMSETYKYWRENALRELLLTQRIPHVSGDVAVFLEIHRNSKVSDLDNRFKAALDAIVEARIIEDDKRIVEISAKWSKTAMRCYVRIEPR